MTAGSRPKHRLKYALAFAGRGDAPSYVDVDGIPVINQGCVHQEGIRWENIKLQDPAKVSASSAWLQSQDVLINSTGTGTLGRVAFVDAEPKEPTIFDGHVTAIRTRREALLPKFLFYWLCNRQEEITANASDGATNQIELNRARLGGFRISLPDLATQSKIVKALDRETSKVDALLKEKDSLLKLLDERRQALITEAVTRGLNPTVPMKDSGHPWLGRVPAHWIVERTRWLFKERDERSTDGAEELLTVSHLTGVTPRSEKDVNMFLAESNEGYKVCHVNDLVINTMWAWMGAMGVSWGHGICSPSYNVYQPDLALIYPEFLDCLSRMPTFVQEVTRYSKGVWSSRLRLYPEGLYQVWLALPPLEEQAEIVNGIRSGLHSMAKVTDETVRSLEILKSFRSSMIEGAVAGHVFIGGHE